MRLKSTSVFGSPSEVCKLAMGSCFVIVVALAGSAQGPLGKSDRPGERFKPELPVGISRTVWRQRIPHDDPITRETVTLGKALFFDKRLSADGTVSCATCHDPANAFTDHNSVATGVSNKVGTRNAPTILNAMFSEQLFWDGRVQSLEEQAKQPLTSPFEMGMKDDEAVVARVTAIAEYRERFRRLFGSVGITIQAIVKAIASYERTQLSGNSPFDRVIMGDKDAMTEAQKRGWELFKGKAKCIECHAYTTALPFFTDFKFYNTGIAARTEVFENLASEAREISSIAARFGSAQLAHSREFSELGRFLVTRVEKDIGAFKTPTLRDVELTGPYMHNGSLKTLLDVVRFYNQGGVDNPMLDAKITRLNLSEQEMSDIVEFMRALTSDDILRLAQSSKPQTRERIPLPLSSGPKTKAISAIRK
jgi:cytochrome c peroxidase